MPFPTIVLGASEKPHQYAHMAVQRLVGADHPVHAVGRRAGRIGAVPIDTQIDPTFPVHTVTMYLSEKNQQDWQERLLSPRPKRVIFNPGAENPAFEKELERTGVEVVHGCTLVMLATVVY
ncbi:MAG: CoA-binding protein [Flavobacteriales bacterium]